MALSKTHDKTSEARIYEEPVFETRHGALLSTRDFTVEVEAGLVAGTKLNMMWTHDAPASRVWPYVSDFNAWQNDSGYYYSANLGEIEGQTFGLGFDPNDTESWFWCYQVEKVIPEFVLIVSQPVLSDEEVKGYGMLGYGGYSGGYHVLTLNDFGGKTTVTACTEHACVMAKPGEAMAREEALAPHRNSGLPHLERWGEGFIPKLRQLVDEGR